MLHSILKQDTFLIGDLNLSQLLLMNDARFLWLILVPKRAEIVELHELSEADQTLLLSEMMSISKVLKQQFGSYLMVLGSTG